MREVTSGAVVDVEQRGVELAEGTLVPVLKEDQIQIQLFQTLVVSSRTEAQDLFTSIPLHSFQLLELSDVDGCRTDRRGARQLEEYLR